MDTSNHRLLTFRIFPQVAEWVQMLFIAVPPWRAAQGVSSGAWFQSTAPRYIMCALMHLKAIWDCEAKLYVAEHMKT